MRAAITLAGVGLLCVVTPAFAHRVDEYLQATTISVSRDRVEAQIRLAPGIEVVPTVLAAIDADRNGAISDAERRAYAERVLGDLSLAVDGRRLSLRLLSSTMSSLEELRDGRGDIRIDFAADVRPGGHERQLVFENHHMPAIAAYLVNGLVPRDTAVSMGAQHRDQEQSSYRLEYLQAGVAAQPAVPIWWAAGGAALAGATLLLTLTRLASRRASKA